MQRESSPTGLIGGGLALAITLGGLVMAWPWDPGIFLLLFVLPSLVGGAIALFRPYDPRALLLAALLVLTQAWLLLIGGFGLVYLAAVALLVHGAVRNRRLDPRERGDRRSAPRTGRPGLTRPSRESWRGRHIFVKGPG